MENMTVNMELEQSEEGGTIFAQIDGNKAGEIVFTMDKPSLMVITHTRVFDGYNGKGLGKQLVYSCVSLAKEKGYQIKPVCPYAVKVFDADSELNSIRY